MTLLVAYLTYIASNARTTEMERRRLYVIQIPWQLHKMVEKTTKHFRITGVPTDIRTQYIPNKSLEQYCCANLSELGDSNLRMTT